MHLFIEVGLAIVGTFSIAELHRAIFAVVSNTLKRIRDNVELLVSESPEVSLKTSRS